MVNALSSTVTECIFAGMTCNSNCLAGLRTILITAFLISTSVAACPGQTSQKSVTRSDQAWFSYLVQPRISRHWGLWFDVHYRLSDFVRNPSQIILRPAITYLLTDNLRLNAGYAYVLSYPQGDFETVLPEHRPWQQIWYRQTHRRVQTLQWLRLEERFRRTLDNGVVSDDFTFNWRLRYNLSVWIPLNNAEMIPGTVFVSLFDELFLNFGDNIVYNTFDQNRFFMGAGFQFTPQFNVHLGYQHVYQQLSPGDQYLSIHSFRLFAVHNLDFRKGD
jgi:hypothetical protein